MDASKRKYMEAFVFFSTILCHEKQFQKTVAGAIEYVIAYAKQTWNCPVIFYTGTQYKSEQYAQMVDLLLQIQEKWKIGVIDLWNDPEMQAVSAEDYKLYMVNGIHPSFAGYRDWWTPKFEAYLTEALG